MDALAPAKVLLNHVQLSCEQFPEETGVSDYDYLDWMDQVTTSP